MSTSRDMKRRGFLSACGSAGTAVLGAGIATEADLIWLESPSDTLLAVANNSHALSVSMPTGDFDPAYPGMFRKGASLQQPNAEGDRSQPFIGFVIAITTTKMPTPIAAQKVPLAQIGLRRLILLTWANGTDLISPLLSNRRP